ncbi:hypothetical protein BCL76_102420 [Streptomyces sp. CG 926]|nr:hypothetical protein BCL76_102420 [Streptomyces sp. CG 926]
MQIAKAIARQGRAVGRLGSTRASRAPARDSRGPPATPGAPARDYAP